MNIEQAMIIPPAIAAMATAANISLDDGYQWLPAARFTAVYHPTVEVELPLIITGIADRPQLLRLAQTLANAYPKTHVMTMVDSKQDGMQTRELQLSELITDELITDELITGELITGELITGNRADEIAPLTALCVPPLPEGSSFSALQAIVAYLRSPVGCPWDREQTLLSMRHDLLSECVEVMEAIDHELDGTDNGEHIAEELGDLFMAGVLTLQIAIDDERFQLADAMQSIVTKLIRRHPHVFGDVQIDGVDAVWANWDAIKAQEKAAKGQVVDHPLDGVPAALPALEKARELQSKAQKANLLDRATLASTWDECLASFQRNRQEDKLREEELGQLLWAFVAVAQQAGINAEDALRSYAVHFTANVGNRASRSHPASGR